MSGRLINKLPTVRGKYVEAAPLATTTWFRVGGPAEVLYKPADLEDLRCFLAEKPAEVPVRVIGVGSNLLVRDGGVSGVVIRLGRGFSNIYVNEDVVDVVVTGGSSQHRIAWLFSLLDGWLNACSAVEFTHVAFSPSPLPDLSTSNVHVLPSGGSGTTNGVASGTLP